MFVSVLANRSIYILVVHMYMVVYFLVYIIHAICYKIKYDDDDDNEW